MSRRPDILAAQARVDAALSGRKVAKAAFYPNVDLLASAGWAAIGLGPLFKPESAQYGGGPAIHLPLFDAGQLRADYTGAVADIDYAVAGYNGTITQAVKDTSDALTRIRSLQDQRVEHERELAAAENAYRLAQTRYRTGLSNQITLLDAENVVFRRAPRRSFARVRQRHPTRHAASRRGRRFPTPTSMQSASR